MVQFQGNSGLWAVVELWEEALQIWELKDTDEKGPNPHRSTVACIRGVAMWCNFYMLLARTERIYRSAVRTVLNNPRRFPRGLLVPASRPRNFPLLASFIKRVQRHWKILLSCLPVLLRPALPQPLPSCMQPSQVRDRFNVL